MLQYVQWFLEQLLGYVGIFRLISPLKFYVQTQSIVRDNTNDSLRRERERTKITRWTRTSVLPCPGHVVLLPILRSFNVMGQTSSHMSFTSRLYTFGPIRIVSFSFVEPKIKSHNDIKTCLLK